MKRKLFILLSLMTVCALFLPACKQLEPYIPEDLKKIVTPEDKPRDEEAINRIVSEAGKVVPAAKEKNEVTIEKEEIKDDIKYVYEKHDVVDNIDSIVYLGLNDDIIWPGNLVKGTRAYDFIYDPISVNRAPVTFSISLESSTGTGSSITQTVDNPMLSSIRQGISDLVKKAIIEDTTVPAKVDFKYKQVYNEEEMNLFVGADISYGAGSLNTKFNWDSTSKKNKIMANYRQIYYSIDIDTPASPASFFASTVNATELTAAMPSGSMPLYISSVSYGMQAMLFIETDYNEEQMKMALDAAYKGAVDVELEFGYSAKEVLQSSNVQIVVYGGSTAGLQDLETDYEGFMKVIKPSTDFGPDTPGVPIVYKFRHLADNTLALITLTSQYTLVKPLQIQQRVRVTVDRFICEMADDEGTNNTVDMDRFFVWANAFNRANTNDPGVQVNPVDQQVYGWSHGGDGHQMDPGSIHDAGTSVVLTFDTENYDFSLATLKLKAFVRDWDTSDSNSEEGRGELSLVGNDMFGDKSIMLYSPDFRIKVTITIMALS
ncbi:thiol-activated cytolysin family protein [Chloroflexota bacterium]